MRINPSKECKNRENMLMDIDMNQTISNSKEPTLKRTHDNSKENRMDQQDSTDSECDNEDDPSQTQAFTQELRNKYSKMIAVTETHRKEFEHETLVETVAAANELFSQVKSTHEAVLDAKLLLHTASLASERVHRLKVDRGSFDMSVFMAKLKLKKSDNREDVEPYQSFYSAVSRASVGIPRMHFMLGPIAVMPKDRREIKRREKLVKDDKDLKRPEELGEEDVTGNGNETTVNVAKIYECLLRVQEMNVFKFFINADSFSQTVENLFHLSFLVRDGKVFIEDDDNGDPFIFPTPMDIDEDEEAQRRPRIQSIFHLDMPTFRALIEKYQITGSVIPHRANSI